MCRLMKRMHSFDCFQKCKWHTQWLRQLSLQSSIINFLNFFRGFKVCQTELNANFEWNETLIYHQFPLERVRLTVLK